MTDLIGRNVDKYHIIEQLGQGGMAVVYKAHDNRLERFVALKFIRKEAIQSEFTETILKRFDREAKALAQLSHPNIVSVYEYGEFEGSPYLVMEYLKGGTLKNQMTGPISFTQSAKMLAPIAHALDYAHRREIIHRDVKPSNILITEDGAPMLSDFGIAKILDTGEATLTATGVGIGTPEYMAPEQSIGTDIDFRADIYSLGIVLYEMITGRRPFIATTPIAVIIKQVNDPLPRPRNFVPDLPEEVEQILYKVLAKAPQDRYQTMAEFATVLERLAQPGAFDLRSSAAENSATVIEPFESAIARDGDVAALSIESPSKPDIETTPDEKPLLRSQRIEQHEPETTPDEQNPAEDAKAENFDLPSNWQSQKKGKATRSNATPKKKSSWPAVVIISLVVFTMLICFCSFLNSVGSSAPF